MKNEFDLKVNKKVYYKGDAAFCEMLRHMPYLPDLSDAERVLERLADEAWYGIEDEVPAELGYYALVETEGYGYDMANEYLALMIEGGYVKVEDVA